MAKAEPAIIDLMPTVEEMDEVRRNGWQCPQCKRRIRPPLTTHIGDDGLERCAECARV